MVGVRHFFLQKYHLLPYITVKCQESMKVWVNIYRPSLLYSNNMVTEVQETHLNKKRPQPGADTPQTVSAVLILPLMRLACMSPALITSADRLRIDMRGSRPSSWTQLVKVTVTGGEVAVQSNYTADDGWVIASDWQRGYGVGLHTQPLGDRLKEPGNWDENH